MTKKTQVSDTHKKRKKGVQQITNDFENTKDVHGNYRKNTGPNISKFFWKSRLQYSRR
jgi:hypothetical protein